jgi:hypothetical protein
MVFNRRWVGLAVAPPEIGQPLIIGTPDRTFRVTTPVTKVLRRTDGVLVQTRSRSRYLINNGGYAYHVEDHLET